MKINVIAVGKLKEKYWTDAIAEYKKRISRYADFEIIELAQGRNLEEEGKEILKKLSGYVIVTDIGGKMLTSEEYAKIFADKLTNGISEFCIVIGSSEGLCDKVKERADLKMSFGKVTYPHQLMRVIIAEQTYRAMAINNNITYHK
ncbi:MAG TPA: 23S rRNA (pseudouridine(1915)-N(3))-methyltransferase RlmH [Clostridia bacterium]|nr:23S rRNA (pseudouridine(1915)-N(3))-methyltransferase RlmH [Clostridia bacterium]